MKKLLTFGILKFQWLAPLMWHRNDFFFAIVDIVVFVAIAIVIIPFFAVFFFPLWWRFAFWFERDHWKTFFFHINPPKKKKTFWPQPQSGLVFGVERPCVSQKASVRPYRNKDKQHWAL